MMNREGIFKKIVRILNRDMIVGIAKSREELRKGELHDWKSFKEIIDE